MHRLTAFVLLSAAASVLAIGCAPPVVSVRHVMPGDVALPETARSLAVQEFTVASGPQGPFGAMAAERLAKRLAGLGVYQVHDAKSADGARAEVTVGGILYIEARDQAAARTIRGMDPATHQPTSQQVPTLLRAVTVRADFDVKARGGRPIGAVETHARYSSSDDPRTRGELGLGRPDDPKAVPPLEMIVGELLDQCAETFTRMVAPTVIAASVPLRPVSGAEGNAGLAAARRGDFAEACRLLKAALDKSPDDVNLRFDLAAGQEAAGDLKAALGHYRKVWEASQQQDRAAREGVRRLERLVRN